MPPFIMHSYLRKYDWACPSYCNGIRRQSGATVSTSNIHKGASSMVRIESLKTITHTLGLRDFALNHFIEWSLLRAESTCILSANHSQFDRLVLTMTIYFVILVTWWYFFFLLVLSPMSPCATKRILSVYAEKDM